MGKIEMNKDNKLNLAAVFIIVFSYAAERLIELFVPHSKPLGIILAMVYTVLLALVVYILSRTKEYAVGLLAAMLGYKMMPVSISFLHEYSVDALFLYNVVKYAAMIMFLVIIYRLYVRQPEPKDIKVPVILAILYCVPFFSEIARFLSSYFYMKTGSMLMPYFAGYACYAAATVIILIIAYYSGKTSFTYAAYFEFAALGINAVKYATKIGYRLINDWHISKSFYLWIVLYAVLAIATAVALKYNEKRE